MNPALIAMLKQYENISTVQKTNNSKEKFDLKNYFSTTLTDKEKTGTRRIRILPAPDGGSPFVEIHGHKAQVDGDNKTFICLKKEKGIDCPFCEAHDELRASGTEADKELAKKYSAKKMYVVRVIDRDKEDEGVKFWRFNHDYRNTGALDKIFDVIKHLQQDITDVKTGRDLSINITRDQSNRPVINTIQSFDPSPLHTDETIVNNWLADNRTWEDVYSIKPYEYLEIVVKGGIPFWDKNSQKFVDKASLSSDKEVKNDSVLATIKPNIIANKEIKVSSNEEISIGGNSDDEDDLPF